MTSDGRDRTLIACNIALSGDANPYLKLFYKALGEHGVALADTAFSDSRAWRRAYAGRVDAIHLHWPELLWRRKVEGTRWMRHLPLGWRLRQRCDPFIRLLRLRSRLRHLKRRGVLVIWTLHNIEPHEGAGAVDRLGYRMLSRCSDLTICHSDSAADEYRHRYRPSGRVVIMRIGNYDGVYPPPRPRNLVRQELGLRADVPLACCLGQIRGYKGLDVVCSAFEGLRGKVQLLVAGKSFAFDVTALQRAMSRLPGSRLIDRMITDQEFADFIEASDVVLLPYRRITGSSVFLAALTAARGVIASDLPYFRDILKDAPAAGRLFPAGHAEALTAAIEDYLAVPAEVRSAAARALADDHAWDRVVVPVVNELRALRG